MTRVPLVLVLLAVAAAPALAQSERVTIKMVPEANQTLRFHNTQDMDMTTESDAPPDHPSPMPSMAMKMHTVMDATSAIGPTDNQGHYTSRMTIDHVSLESTMNGRPMPMPAIDMLEKQAITFSYDDQGRVIDLALDGAAPPAIAATIKQMMTRAFATVAPMTLSVGESVKVPVALDMPVPGAPATTGFDVASDTVYTLTSVTFDGADRIAHLNLRVASTMTPKSSTSATPMPTMTMTMTGDGKMDINVDRGIILHAEQRATIDSAMQPPAAASGAPSIRMHGTLSSVSDLVKE
jgi:hypothetical protein